MEDVTVAIGVASALVAGGVVAYLLTRSAPPGRKLNPFSAKMAEGVFAKKVGAPTGAISAALYFSELPSSAELQALMRDKLLSFDVFTSVFRSGYWVPVEVDLAAHVFEATVGSEAELLAYCETEMVAPLRNSAGAPLWEVHAVRNTGGGRSMLFFRLEHAIGDGVALNQVPSRTALVRVRVRIRVGLTRTLTVTRTFTLTLTLTLAPTLTLTLTLTLTPTRCSHDSPPTRRAHHWRPPRTHGPPSRAGWHPLPAPPG